MNCEEVIAKVEAGRTAAVHLLRDIADRLEGLSAHEAAEALIRVEPALGLLSTIAEQALGVAGGEEHRVLWRRGARVPS